MKKTISINIGGFVLSIEEDAYLELSNYLETLKRFYENNISRDEILADIEASIAEKFKNILNQSKQVINISDVKEIIKIMGDIKDIDEDANNTEEENRDDGSKRRLYRDIDNAILGGVASGIAAYFDIDPVFIRLAFIILTLFNGVGVLVYLVLWFITPKAETNVQKLEMRGKKINISGIEKAIVEKSKEIGKESKDAFYKLKRKKIWYRIINAPVVVLENLILVIKRILKALGPVLLVFFGILFFLGSLFGIICLSGGMGAIMLNINSPYIVSDIPLPEIASGAYYYLGMVSIYFACLIPLIIFLLLGLTMFRRKNSFKALVMGILLFVWTLSIVGCIIVGSVLAPKTKQLISEREAKEKITKEFNYKDFDKLYIKDDMVLKVKKGDKFKIVFSGREKDLKGLDFRIDKGQLQISQKKIDDGRLCLACLDKHLTGEIVMPNLNSIVTIDDSDVNVEGFDKNLYVSVGESSNLNINLINQDIEFKLAGMHSNLSLRGKCKNIKGEMIGYSNLNFEDLEAEKMDLDMKYYSDASLKGKIKTIKIRLDNYATFRADDFKAEEINIETYNNSEAKIFASKLIKASSYDHSSIYYNKDVKKIESKKHNESVINNKNSEEEIREDFE